MKKKRTTKRQLDKFLDWEENEDAKLLLKKLGIDPLPPFKNEK